MNLGALLAVQNVQFQFDLQFFLDFVFRPSPALIGGLAITIYVAVAAQLMGVVLGILSALAGMSRNPILRTISGVYVWFFRGTPVLVQIFLVYFGTPYLLGGLDLFPNHIQVGPLDMHGAILAGLVALGVNEGAYMSEIVRCRHLVRGSRPDGGGEIARHDLPADDEPDRPAPGASSHRPAAR